MRKQAPDQSNVGQRKFMGSAPAAAIVDARSNFVMANDAFCILLARAPYRVLGQPMTAFSETWFGRAIVQLPLSALDDGLPSVSYLVGPELGGSLILSCSVGHSLLNDRRYLLVATPIAHTLPSDQLIDYATRLEHNLIEGQQEVDRSLAAANRLRNLLSMGISNHALDQMLDYVYEQAQQLLAASGMVVLSMPGVSSIMRKPDHAEILYAKGAGGALSPESIASAPLLTLLEAQPGAIFLPAPTACGQETAFSRLAVPLLIEDEIYGAMILDLEASQLSPNAHQVVAWLADQVIVAHGADRLQQRAQEAAALQERERLAREMHDAVTQSIYSLTLFAEAGRRVASLGQIDRVQDYLQQLSETAKQALKELRLLLYELQPAVLEQVGLIEALRQRLEAVEQRTGMSVRLDVEGDIAFPAHVEDGLYRICQEALNNALKHASASAVTVYLGIKDGEVHLEICDDGVGFDADDPKMMNGDGMNAMSERVRLMNARLVVKSAPQQGACVQVLMSIPNSAE